MIKVVLFNGAPRSGKDTAANLVTAHLDLTHPDLVARPIKYATPLKRATHEMFGLSNIDENHFEDSKDEPNEAFKRRVFDFQLSFLISTQPRFGEQTR